MYPWRPPCEDSTRPGHGSLQRPCPRPRANHWDGQKKAAESALSTAALGTMRGAFVKSEAQAESLSIRVGMLMALLGGCWYPLDLFPAAGVLLGFAAVFFTVGALRFRWDQAGT